MNAYRSTHRVRVWDSPDAAPRVVPARLGDDRILRDADGFELAILGVDGEWYWIGPHPARWTVHAAPGPKPRGGPTRRISIRFPGRRPRLVSIPVTELEAAAFRSAAGSDGEGVSGWLRDLAGGRPRKAAQLREIARKAAGLK